MHGRKNIKTMNNTSESNNGKAWEINGERNEKDNEDSEKKES
tara:strand:- start:19756 stop:19881 length:126 start_codon:yes stop_codon:yes gene_type:complete